MPNASSMRGVTGYRVSDAMNGALAQIVPDRVPAAGEGGIDARLVRRPRRRRAVRLQRARRRHLGRAAGQRRQRRPREPVRVDRERPRRGRRDRVADRDRALRPRPRLGRCRAATAAGSRSSASGAASCPDTAVHVRSDRQMHRPYGLAGGGRARVVEPDHPRGRRPRAAAADVRRRAPARRRLPPPHGRRRRLGRPT